MSLHHSKNVAGSCPFGVRRDEPLSAHCAASDAKLPITVGNLLDFPDDPIRTMRKIYARHGKIGALEQDNQRIYFVFGPELNQQVLSDPTTFHSRFFAIRGPRNSAQRRLTSGLLSMNGDEHKRQRRLVMGPFQRKSVQGYGDSLHALAEEMIDGWKIGETRDIFQDMTQFMLRVTSSVLFGFDMSDLAYSIGRKIERWVNLNHQLGIGALVPDDKFSAGYQDLMQQADALEGEILRMIEFRRNSSEMGSDVLSLLIGAYDDEGVSMSDADLIGQAAILFAAAHLTTANTLTWTQFLLAQHPEISENVCDELRGTLGGDSAASHPLEELPLLNRVVLESMRVLPASSYSQRINAEPVQLGPFTLPSSSLVIFSQFITHHMPDLFPQPEKFLPGRWESIDPSPYAYLPFAAGPRMCIGATLAMMTIKIALAAIMQRVQLSVVSGANINGKVLSTMLTPTTGMMMRVDPLGARRQQAVVRGNIHQLMELPASGASQSVRRAA